MNNINIKCVCVSNRNVTRDLRYHIGSRLIQQRKKEKERESLQKKSQMHLQTC